MLFALLNVFTLIPSQHLNPYVMAFMRYFFGTLMLLPIVLKLGLHRSMSTNRLPLHLFRGCIHACGMFLWFVGLPLTTLASITALGFTGPIFVTIGAAMFLGERVRMRRWMAVLVGLCRRHDHHPPGRWRPWPGRDLHPDLDPDLLRLEPDLQGAGADRDGQQDRDLAAPHHPDLRLSGGALVLADAEPDRSAVVRRRGPMRHAGPYLPAERLSARRHHLAAADRLPVAAVERVAGLLPVLPAARCLDLRRRGRDLCERPLHLPPRSGAARGGESAATATGQATEV